MIDYLSISSIPCSPSPRQNPLFLIIAQPIYLNLLNGKFPPKQYPVMAAALFVPRSIKAAFLPVPLIPSF